MRDEVQLPTISGRRLRRNRATIDGFGRGLTWDHSRRLRPLLLSTARLRPKRFARPLESVDGPAGESRPSVFHQQILVLTSQALTNRKLRKG
nr:MAG TPA: hypothetical protein [Caudoviricetes sp.]